MVIAINDMHEVVLVADGIISEDLTDMNAYSVEDVPKLEIGKKMCFDPESGTFYFKEYTKEEKESIKAAHELFKKREKAREQKEEALRWLSENDWKVNKCFLGEWEESDERWKEYVSTRAKMRRMIDEADAILNA